MTDPGPDSAGGGRVSGRPGEARSPALTAEREGALALLWAPGLGDGQAAESLALDASGVGLISDPQQELTALLEVLLLQCARNIRTLGLALAIHEPASEQAGGRDLDLVKRISERLRRIAVPLVGLKIIPGSSSEGGLRLDFMAVGRRTAALQTEGIGLWFVDVPDTGGVVELTALNDLRRALSQVPRGGIGFVVSGRDPIGDLRLQCARPGFGAHLDQAFLAELPTLLRPDALGLIVSVEEHEVKNLRAALAAIGLGLRLAGSPTGTTGLELVPAERSQTSLFSGTPTAVAELPLSPTDLGEEASGRLTDLPEPTDYEAVFLELSALPWIASPRALWDRCDRFVGLRHDPAVDAGATLIDARGEVAEIALAVAAAPRASSADPYLGGCIAVAEAVRKLAARGARAEALGVCFRTRGATLAAVSEGLRDATRAYGISTIDVGWAKALAPGRPAADPLVMVVGPALAPAPATWISRSGEIVVLLGRTREEFGASELVGLRVPDDLPTSLPWVDFDAERRLVAATLAAVAGGMVSAAQSVAAGGLAMALLALCASAPPQVSGLGLNIRIEEGMRPDGFLFGESQARMVLVVPTHRLVELRDIAQRHEVPLLVLGETGGDVLRVAGLLTVAVESLQSHWRKALAGA